MMNFPFKRIVVFYPTGGVADCLRLLGGTLLFAEKFHGTVYMVSKYHRPLAHLGAGELFEPQHLLKEAIPWSPTDMLLAPLPRNWTDYRPVWRAKGIYDLEGNAHQPVRSGALPAKARKLVTFTTGSLSAGDAKDSTFSYTRTQGWSASLHRLKLADRFAERIAQRKKSLKDTPYIGVHFRNTDYKADFARTLETLESALDSTGIETVFWSTDDLESVAKARAHLGRTRILSFQAFGARGLRNLHTGLDAQSSLAHLEQTFCDLWTLASSAYFIPSSGPTGWTGLVGELRKNGEASGRFFGTQIGEQKVGPR